MEADLSLLPDFIIKGCIPNCEECPGTWKNECIKHRIVCQCRECKHGDSSEQKSRKREEGEVSNE